MKYFAVILLLSVCGFSASFEIFEDFELVEHVKYDPQIPTELIVIDGLASTVDHFIKESVGDFNGALDEYNSLSRGLKDKIEKIVQLAKDKVAEALEKVQEKILELKKKGGALKKCGDKYEKEIQELKELAIDGIKECTKDIAKAVKDFTVEVGAIALKLKANVEALTTLVLNCYNKDGTISQAKCAIQSIRQVKDLIVDIVKNTKDLVVTAKVKFDGLVESVTSCKENKIDVILAKVNEVRSKVDECYKNEIN